MSGGLSGFNGIFSGIRFSAGTFMLKNIMTFIWSSSPVDLQPASLDWYFDSSPYSNSEPDNRIDGFPVRCIKD
jgi:uncharacterized protein (TIGR02145 family)